MQIADFGARIRGLALSAAIALLATGCGGSDGGSATTSAPSPQLGSPVPTVGNTAPTIQGRPGPSVLAGQSYSFQATAVDPDGDSLIFSATNLPPWASLDGSSGRLAGTPTRADVGSYEAVTISVTDGKATVSLAPFNILVSAIGTGSATLFWVPPTQNTDGSTAELGGYQITYGRSADDLSQSIAVSNPSVNTYVVENLTSGAWFFAVVAMSAKGIASAPSNVASKTIS